MQILIPISGRTSFFPKDEYFFPKPLIEVSGQPMIELVIDSLKHDFPDADFTFIVDREDAREFSLDRVLRLAAGESATIVERLGDTSGGLCSCLLAIDALDPDRELLIFNSDQIITDNLAAHVERFNHAGADAGVITFDAVHPRWCYVVADGSEVVQAFEKKVMSRHAVAGFYYFRKAETFLLAAQKAVLNDANVNGLFYISASLNEALLMNCRVVLSQIDARDYHSFFEPSRISAFERSPAAASIREREQAHARINVILPAAGEGSRFAKAGWKKPKPFIDVLGRPMLSHVIDNVSPMGSQTTVLLRKQHQEEQASAVLDLEAKGVTVIPVEKLTEGTAATVLLARRLFDDDRPMIVANSDQIVEFNVSDFVEDCFNRQLDGSILVFRDTEMDPKWSFARVGAYGLVQEVAEKKPISDLATVGIYLFARGKDFVGAAADMMAANERVNGEFYTCPVYNFMIAQGARIGVYEVPVHAMQGLGTPEDLEAFLKKQGAGPSPDAPD
ncbi:glycosyltransferase family 2 protein [Erythrobacter sp. T5W1-R]|uniref:glycosyltransferase family 2 protein n=1 Tax=Erythrobacter sp. T5W1-R TaxID=3101752 RepID=UPI002B000A47|nr:glycosyltransferase family 2 protein [Erythrobacter sp. T5W1-R]MEA1618171.1 glycosyltransferase family 2 protein [Erythrobacter sp. T5W1-R]